MKKQPNTADIECLISKDTLTNFSFGYFTKHHFKISTKLKFQNLNKTTQSLDKFNQLHTQHDNDQTWVGQNDLHIFDVSCTYHYLPHRCNNLDEPLWGAARVAHHRFCLFCQTELFFQFHQLYKAKDKLCNGVTDESLVGLVLKRCFAYSFDH